MTGEPMTFAHTCQGTIALMAEIARLSYALAERDAEREALISAGNRLAGAARDAEYDIESGSMRRCELEDAGEAWRALAAAPGAAPTELASGGSAAPDGREGEG